MENLDEAHNGPAIKHSIRVLDHAVKQLTVIVTVTSTLAQFSDPIHDQFSVRNGSFNTFINGLISRNRLRLRVKNRSGILYLKIANFDVMFSLLEHFCS